MWTFLYLEIFLSGKKTYGVDGFYNICGIVDMKELLICVTVVMWNCQVREVLLWKCQMRY